MIADVVFDIPRGGGFTYRVPSGLRIAVGQRVRAPLHGRSRIGVVVDCREGADDGLKAVESVVDPRPLLGPVQLDLTRWISAESYSSWGSTCAALLPPPPPELDGSDLRGPEGMAGAKPSPPQLLTGADREERLLALLAAEVGAGGVLVLVPEIEAASAWAGRLRSRLGEPVVRLDSGCPERERWQAWVGLARGAVRAAVGTRSALLAPVPPPATVVLVDEHDPAHKPPGHPRIHSREVVLERGRREGCSVILTSAAPSVESWWRTDSGAMVRVEGSTGEWPEVTIVDVRGGARGSPLSPALRRGIKETLAAGGQACLLVTRVSSVLACGECGFLLRCAECRIALAYSRASRECTCRLCGRREPAPDTCANCLGRQLAPLGWGAERVEQAVRQAFPRLAIARYDRAALSRGRAAQLARQWRDCAVRVVIGTRQVLRALAPGTPQLVGVITPDHLLRLPDFRAGERTFALLWAAAEWAGGEGRLIVQTQYPEHYAVRAAAAQELSAFYKPELRFREEAGYPPFRRLCLLTIRDRDRTRPGALAGVVRQELSRLGGLAVYGPVPHGKSGRGPRWRIVVKGGSDLPGQLRPALAPLLQGTRSASGMVEVEMDPIELV